MTTPLEAGLADLGYHEQPPGSNRTKYGDRFWPGRPSPWCAEAVSVWTRDTGSQGPWDASVGFYQNKARAMGLHLGRDRAAALDALHQGLTVAVGYEWERDTWPDHIGLLVADEGGNDRTLEGNSPGADRRLGDAVAYHVRPTNLVAFYSVIHPPSPAAPPAPPGPTPAPAPAHPAGPVLPAWMVLAWHPNGRPGFTNHGDRVAVLQAYLKGLGGPWDPGPVDGVIGPRTNDIIGRLQAANHLRVDHEVGQATWHAAFG
jgi:peptidoglycan hydrolase-like protein with peptidoglycan-binding domain